MTDKNNLWERESKETVLLAHVDDLNNVSFQYVVLISML